METNIEIVWQCKNCGVEIDECDGCKEHFMPEDKIECVVNDDITKGIVWHLCEPDCFIKTKVWKKK